MQFTVDETVRSVYPSEAPFERSYLESSDMVMVEILVGEDGAVQDAAAIKGTEAEIDYVFRYLKDMRFKSPVRVAEGRSVGVVRVKLNRQPPSSGERLSL